MFPYYIIRWTEESQWTRPKIQWHSRIVQAADKVAADALAAEYIASYRFGGSVKLQSVHHYPAGR